MVELSVAALQVRPAEGPEDSLARVVQLVREAKEVEPDVVCLPESWLLADPSQLDEALSFAPRLVEELKDIAKELECFVFGGGIYEEREAEKVISCPVIGPTGRVLGRQLKTHLFRREQEVFKRGDSYHLFDVNDVGVGVLVCHDAVYPEAARILALKGAELILNPSRIPQVGLNPWQSYVRVRALENRVPMVAPNVTVKPHFGGGTFSVDLKVHEESGVVLTEERFLRGEEPGVLNVTLDPSRVEEQRWKRLSNRHVDSYGELLSPSPQALKRLKVGSEGLVG